MGVVIKETIRTSIVNYIGILLGVVNVLWLQTAILSEGEIGLIKYYFDLSILFTPFIVLGVNSLPGRFLHRFKTLEERQGFLTFLIVLPLFLFILFCLSFFISLRLDFFGLNSKIFDEEYIVPFIVLVFSNVYILVLEGVLQGLSKVFFPALFKNVFIRLMLTVVLGMYYYELITFETLFLCYSLFFLVDFIALVFYLNNLLPIRFNLSFFYQRIKKEVIRYSLFLLVGAGGVVLMSKIDTLMIKGVMFKEADVYGYIGVYGISFFIASVIEVPIKIIGQLLYPEMAKAITDKEYGKLDKMYKQSSIIFTIVGIYVFFIIWYNLDSLFKIIPNGEVYSKGKLVVLFIGLSKIFDMFFGFSHGILVSTKYYRLSLFLVPWLIMLTIVSNYFLIPLYGIIGAALATSVSVYLYSLTRYLLVYFLLKMNSLTWKHFQLFIIIAILIAFLEAKPILFNNFFLEIVFNTIFISIIFIGLLFKVKISEDLNSFIILFFKKIKSYI